MLVEEHGLNNLINGTRNDLGEDLNGNGVLDPSEDLDGDGTLDNNEDTNGINTAFTETIGRGTSSISSIGTSGTGRTIAEHRASGSFTRTSADTSTETDTRTEETTRSKLTLAEIRTRQKEKVIESIDKGIEPGLSMAASGENLGRGGLTRTKLLKKPLEELTGDETGASIGDQKEGELKRVGINLNTFKSKKFVG